MLALDLNALMMMSQFCLTFSSRILFGLLNDEDAPVDDWAAPAGFIFFEEDVVGTGAAKLVPVVEAITILPGAPTAPSPPLNVLAAAAEDKKFCATTFLSVNPLALAVVVVVVDVDVADDDAFASIIL